MDIEQAMGLREDVAARVTLNERQLYTLIVAGEIASREAWVQGMGEVQAQIQAITQELRWHLFELQHK